MGSYCFGFVGFSLHLNFGIIFVMETSAPFPSVQDSDLTSAFPILASFRWWMLFFVRSVDGFGPHVVLIPIIKVCKSHEVYNSYYTSFAFKIALCVSLKRTGLIIWLISYFVCIVYFCIWISCRGAHPFLVF